MCVRAYGRLVSVMDVRVFCACARGERLFGVINIILSLSPCTVSHQLRLPVPVLPRRLSLLRTERGVGVLSAFAKILVGWAKHRL